MAGLEGFRQVGARSLDGRNEPEEQARTHRDEQSKPEHAKIQAGIECDRKWAWGDQRPEQLASPDRDEDAQHTAEAGKDQALGQQLTDQTHPPGSQGYPDRDLAPSGRGTNHKKVGNVGRRDGEHQQSYSGQQGHGQGDSCRGLEIDPRKCVQDHRAASVRLRVFLLEVRGDRFHLGLGLLYRDPGPEPADQIEHQGATFEYPVGTRRDIFIGHRRDEKFRCGSALCSLETLRADADDGERLPVQGQLPPDDRILPAETVLPAAVAEDEDRVGSGCLFLAMNIEILLERSRRGDRTSGRSEGISAWPGRGYHSRSSSG